jgi:hypothetical protein
VALAGFQPLIGSSRQAVHLAACAFVQGIRGSNGAEALSIASDLRGIVVSSTLVVELELRRPNDCRRESQPGDGHGRGVALLVYDPFRIRPKANFPGRSSQICSRLVRSEKFGLFERDFELGGSLISARAFPKLGD